MWLQYKKGEAKKMILYIDTTRKKLNGGHVEAYAQESARILFGKLSDAVEFARNCKAIRIIKDYIIIA